jgi:1,4-alpha-glucan branching enzyme
MKSQRQESKYRGFFSQTKALKMRMGAHAIKENGKITAFSFSVWAPNASEVSVVGAFNGWDGFKSRMKPQKNGVWSVLIPGVPSGASYKYLIKTRYGETFFRADPCAKYAELRPSTASRTWSGSFRWSDTEYRAANSDRTAWEDKPMAIYEIHAGSWRASRRGGLMNYRELADTLVDYLKEFGFSHVELMPIAEHPYDGSWGYQTTGYFAPTSRYGTPDDFKYFVNLMHQNKIAVILDWVPAHFPKDESGLRLFDGTPLFEPQNDNVAEQPLWGTLRFDFSNEYVRDFLISNALYWFSEFHIDGLRVDAVSSMLYPDFSRDGLREEGQQGAADSDAIGFLQLLNTEVTKHFPYALIIAEDSTDFPGVTKPVSENGLGFTHKWNMGWMNDTLKYMETDPLFRSGCHNLMNFSLSYAFTERFILPLSHDECVHGKKSLIDKMFGDYFNKFASLRSYLLYMFTHPGKKLLFMGTEFGQFIEWRYYEPLEWKLLEYESHRKLSGYVKDLIRFYVDNPALWKNDDGWDGFLWSNADDTMFDVYSYFRMAGKDDVLLIILNTTPVERRNYLLGTDFDGSYSLVFNTDDEKYFGGGAKVKSEIQAEALPQGNFSHRLCVDLPPEAALIYRQNPKPKE